MENSRNIWNTFWANKSPEIIYPPVTDIVGELQKFVDVQNKKILETGAGTGRDGIKLSRLGADVWLLDYSEMSLKLARQYLNKVEEVKFVMADALRTPFRDESFDIVFHQGLLEHFKDPLPLIRENYRILKKEGFLLVDVPQTFHLYTLIKHILMFIRLWFAGWERQFTIDSLTHILKGQNLEPVYFYGDWSRPGIIYKIIREILRHLKIKLPMYPSYLGNLTKNFYKLQQRLVQKKIFLYTVHSIGIIAQKR
ncbi:MAG: methyltransferase domain-containing protein [bacterium]